MDDLTIARALHVLGVLMWIGGVAFVTTIVMPFIRRSAQPAERLEAFHRIEGRFASQARFWVLLAGASGLWMTYRANMWDRFADPQFWWMHAMVAVWLLFAAMLFLIEPLYLHRRMENSPAPARDYQRFEKLHRVLLAISLITLLGAVAGSHGLLIF